MLELDELLLGGVTVAVGLPVLFVVEELLLEALPDTFTIR